MTAAPVRWWYPVLLCLACDAGPEPPALDLPPRAADTPAGEEIYHAIGDLELHGREELLYREVARGIPPPTSS